MSVGHKQHLIKCKPFDGDAGLEHRSVIEQGSDCYTEKGQKNL